MRPLPFLRAYMRGRLMARGHASRDAFLAWQAGQIDRFMRQSLPRFAAFQHFGPETRLADLPITDKAGLLADFPGHTRDALDLAQVRETVAGAGGLRRGWRKLHLGQSTGTSGNRGYYVIDERERYAWLGAILGKMLPDFWRCRHRVAVVLPRNTPLYTGANRALGLSLRFFGTDIDPEQMRSQIAAWSPDILIAAPRIALLLGDMSSSLHPSRVIVGSEVAEPVDMQRLRRRFARVEEIYMATEGLIATTCSHGALHLSEDFMHVELDKVEGSELVSPVITDFSRHSQALVRYRMNDLLRRGSPCTCGSNLQKIEQVLGRQDDCFRVTDQSGRPRLITPDLLRDRIIAAHPEIEDYELVQTSPGACVLGLPERLEPHLAMDAASGLRSLFESMGVGMEVATRTLTHAQLLSQRAGPNKLRRIRSDAS